MKIYIFFIVIRTRNVHFVRESDRSSFKSEVRISNNIFDSIDTSNFDFFFFENKLYIRVKTFDYISIFLFFFIELHESKHDVVWHVLKFENWKNIGWNNIRRFCSIYQNSISIRHIIYFYTSYFIDIENKKQKILMYKFLKSFFSNILITFH